MCFRMSRDWMRRAFITLCCLGALLCLVLLVTLHLEFVHKCERDVDVYLEALKAGGLGPTAVFAGVNKLVVLHLSRYKQNACMHGV